jgi:hypothetical protein
LYEKEIALKTKNSTNTISLKLVGFTTITGMKKLSAIIVFLFLSFTSFSQGYIGGNRTFIKKSLKQAKSGIFQKTVTETDDTITMTITDAARMAFKLTLYLDNAGKCDTEVRTTDCESCFQKYLEASLAYKDYEWQKLNSTQYVSASSKRMLLEIDTTKTYSFTIRQLDKKQYDALVRD